MTRKNWVGFANEYMKRCCETKYHVNTAVYAKLVEFDTKLGMKNSEQLLKCLCYTASWDIIKV